MKTSTLIGRLLALTIIASALAPLAFADDERSTKGVFLGLEGFGGDPTSSYTRVAEFGDRGDTLRLRKDLGMEVVGEGTVRGGYRFDSDQSLQLSASFLFLFGDKDTSEDFRYDGTTFLAGSDVESRPLYIVPELRYDRVLLRWGQEGNGKLTGDIALRADLLRWDFATSLTTGSEDEGKVNFYEKPIVLPVLGLGVQQPLASKLDGYAFIRGMRANHWPNFAFAKEGGYVYDSESFVEIGVGVIYRINGHMDISAGYRFLYIDYAQTSDEDGNYYKIQSHGVALGFTYYF